MVHGTETFPPKRSMEATIAALVYTIKQNGG